MEYNSHPIRIIKPIGCHPSINEKSLRNKGFLLTLLKFLLHRIYTLKLWIGHILVLSRKQTYNKIAENLGTVGIYNARRSAMNITQDFIDERFKAFVLDNFCENREWIQTSDVDRIVSLQLANHTYSSLKGIEHFASLEELDCSYNNITELDISKNINLRTLDCGANQLTTLDTGNNPLLEKLSCSYNELAQLDISRNPLLKELNCNKNEFRSLNLTDNEKLELLDCGFNRIRNLDISQNAMLAKLVCYWNIITELRVDQNKNLQELNCGYNSMFDLNLDHNTRLTHLDCGNNYLISLNVKGCSDLIEIRCNHNHLTNLDVSGNPALQSLRCFNNHIAKLDLSHNPHLVEIYCSENKISVLDTSHNPNLERLDYVNNLIVEPDLTLEGIGTFQYDSSRSFYKTTVHYMGNEIPVSAEVSNESDMKRLSPIIMKAWERFEELSDQALNLIATTHPDEDVTQLAIAELEFNRDNTFRLGYDAGETPAGQLCIYVAFNINLEMSSDLVYETY
ncbi:hypothetical protein JCM10914_4296 [Paenibacillus sp. JCM 10914]|nr:hypothetical protein JCM10914_4296 [Paenibacillus sp. JCM 10914]